MTADLISMSHSPDPVARKRHNGKPVELLVVDDDPLQREFAICQLSGPEVRVHTAADGEEGWLQLAEGDFDAALIDLDMPKLDGLGLIACIRAEPKHRDMAILVVSGRDDPEALDQSYRDGAFVFCPKPVSWRLLKVQLEHALDMARLRRLGYLQSS